MIDSGIQKPWPEEVIEALSRFKQGDLVREPPFFYWGVPTRALWELSVAADGEDTEPDVVIAEEGNPAWGMITTQTCDLQEEGVAAHKRRRPWFTVAPVYSVEDDDQGKRGLIERHRVGHLTHVTGLEGFWVADTRIEIPIEKNWLVERDPVGGFRTDDEYRLFAQRLAESRGRPAILNIIYRYITTPLRARLEKLPAADISAVLDPVSEVALAIAGSAVSPESVELVVLSDGECPEATQEWFDSWWEEARDAAEAGGINLLPPRYASLGQGGLTVDEYRRMYRLPWDDLST